MPQHILIIGGTRFFGLRLVQRLLDEGHRVTVATRGQQPDPFADRVQRLQVDRRDPQAMLKAFAGRSYDIVYDQVCYHPLDARISLDTFAERTGRYVMASTIEVYRPLLGRQPVMREQDFDPYTQAVQFDVDWLNPALAEVRYSAGKRQAEACLYQDGRLPLVSVRIGHVLGGKADFTGRLAHYVRLVQQGRRLVHGPDSPSAYIGEDSIAAFLHWLGQVDVLGPLNAADQGSLTPASLMQQIARVLDVEALIAPSTTSPEPQGGPFDFGAPYLMDTFRAQQAGYRFPDLLPQLVPWILAHAETPDEVLP
ncbi:NAD-dependent epimerase/dehydratase family protein [Paludibacterium sp. B53371]|uniref:NAD-dependent epimerase/dehydratase family protein n=1 Tax=Paludibacterium sp. B53371 TaxID=2806263 RepID=UPI001C05DC92|nr:NAD-dependent epimerase/dehydratase family protein [Paludibacterium sp. B53371]